MEFALESFIRSSRFQKVVGRVFKEPSNGIKIYKILTQFSEFKFDQKTKIVWMRVKSFHLKFNWRNVSSPIKF